jgi:hypothetical protein
VLVSILLLNVMGYYWVFLGMQYHHDRSMTRVLDANRYDDSQTVTIKVPVSIPYMNDKADFERVDGKFEHQGQHYRLVKQRYAKDTLTVICVRDYENEKISKALSGYVSTFSDDCPEQRKHAKTMMSFIKDYLPHTFGLSMLTSGWETDVARNGLEIDLIATFTTSVIHPPEQAFSRS